MATTANEFFSPWEMSIDDWESAQDAINIVLAQATESRNLAWRGVVDADFPLHSSLYRRLKDSGGRSPDEAELVANELAILRRAREVWRFDNMPALEVFAHMQHYGGPTRLLDVTFNPLIALWFAVEQKFQTSGRHSIDRDGRLFAFDVTDREISLDTDWGGRALPWHGANQNEWRRELPRVWRPPSYNERIPAQNSAFLVGGVPLMNAGDNSRFYRKGPGAATTMGMWSIDDVRSVTSVPLRMNALARRTRSDGTPTYTLRILASAKSRLRTVLEKNFGFSSSTIYPDLFGLATNVANGIVM